MGARGAQADVPMLLREAPSCPGRGRSNRTVERVPNVTGAPPGRGAPGKPLTFSVCFWFGKGGGDDSVRGLEGSTHEHSGGCLGPAGVATLGHRRAVTPVTLSQPDPRIHPEWRVVVGGGARLWQSRGLVHGERTARGGQAVSPPPGGCSAHICALSPQIPLPLWTWCSCPGPRRSGQAGGRGPAPGTAICSGSVGRRRGTPRGVREPSVPRSRGPCPLDTTLWSSGLWLGPMMPGPGPAPGCLVSLGCGNGRGHLPGHLRGEAAACSLPTSCILCRLCGPARAEQRVRAAAGRAGGPCGAEQAGLALHRGGPGPSWKHLCATCHRARHLRGACTWGPLLGGHRLVSEKHYPESHRPHE